MCVCVFLAARCNISALAGEGWGEMGLRNFKVVFVCCFRGNDDDLDGMAWNFCDDG
jgi:hypothetical protein